MSLFSTVQGIGPHRASLGTHTIVEKISEDGEDYGSKYYDVNFYVDKSKQTEQSEIDQEETSKPYLNI